MGQVTVTMSTEKTTQDVSADGSVMISAIAGDNGQVAIEVQQTSDLHDFLLAWYNLIKSALDNGDVTNWANAALTLRNVEDGSTHICTGLAPTKVPDKVYAAQGGKLVWTLMAGDIQSMTA